MGQRLIITEEERSQINKMYGLVNEQDSKQGTLKLKVFPLEKYEGEDGSERFRKAPQAAYFIDVDTTPLNVDNKDVTFSYSVRGRKEKGEGQYRTDFKDEIILDTCFLDEWGDEKVYTTFDGKEISCGQKEFRLSPKGIEEMRKIFGTVGYVSNDKGDDMSNMA